MLERHLNTTAYKLSSTRNAYGDFVKGTKEQSYKARLRENIILNGANQMEGTNADAVLWLEPNAPVEVNSIWEVNGQILKVTKVLNAIKLGATRTEFIKATVTNISQIIS